MEFALSTISEITLASKIRRFLKRHSIWLSLQQEAEQAIVSTSSASGGQGIVILPGVRSIMDEFVPWYYLSNPCWTICTSATRAYASSALSIANISAPDVFVTSEDVSRGRPFPDPYPSVQNELASSRRTVLSLKTHLLVFARPQTIAVLTTHSREQIEAAQPDSVIKDL